jgi:photosystem II stability/assembly factor-like uncharacterized protein
VGDIGPVGPEGPAGTPATSSDQIVVFGQSSGQTFVSWLYGSYFNQPSTNVFGTGFGSIVSDRTIMTAAGGFPSIGTSLVKFSVDGLNWIDPLVPVSAANFSGLTNINGLAYDISTGFYVAVTNVGVLYSTDPTNSWTQSSYTPSGILNGVASNNNGVFIAVDGSDIIRSTDGGDTWSVVATNAGIVTPYFMTGSYFVVSIAAPPPYSFLRSADNGLTWTAITTPAQLNQFSAKFGRWYASYDLSPPAGVYFSTNLGASWTNITTLTNLDVVCFARGGTFMYAAGIFAGNQTVFYTKNGQSWFKALINGSTSGTINTMVVR